MGRPTSGAIRRLSTAQLISSTRFGVAEFGQHARTAIGAGGLPHDITVEINGEFEIAD